MGRIRIDPRQQFSKKLARWTSVFWFLYMTWLSVIILLQPAAALYVVLLAMLTTIVMFINIYEYTKNSIYEKSAFAMLDKLELNLKHKSDTETEEETEDEKEGDEG